jgi:enamine deaminase RidA (YjgF/YER057c/UK114 family)
MAAGAGLAAISTAAHRQNLPARPSAALPLSGAGSYRHARNSERAREQMSIKRLEIGKRLSQAVVHGDTVYLAGIVADDFDADVKTQTSQILDKIDRLLASAGSDKRKILSASVWLADIRDYDSMNSLWDAWVPAGETPARACVEARLAQPRIRVEIRVTAAL